MPSLEDTINDLIADADSKARDTKTEERPRAAKIRLKHGLVLNLRKNNNYYTLTIWRTNQYPAFKEWNTVCSFWPYPIGIPICHKGRYNSRWYLQGQVPCHPKTTMLPPTFV